METESKFKRAVQTAQEITQVPAPEMTRDNFEQIRQDILTHYSHPITAPDPQTLVEAGYTPSSLTDGTMYSDEHDAIVFNTEGQLIEHWHWPEGRGTNRISYAAYDNEGYITVEEERVYNPAAEVKNRSQGSHRTRYEYEITEGGKVPVKAIYRNMLVTQTLQVSPYMIDSTEFVIDLKAPPKKHHHLHR